MRSGYVPLVVAAAKDVVEARDLLALGYERHGSIEHLKTEHCHSFACDIFSLSSRKVLHFLRFCYQPNWKTVREETRSRLQCNSETNPG